MPFRLRKAPKRDLYWVVDDTGKKYSKDPMPKEKAREQQKALYAAEGRGEMEGRGTAEEEAAREIGIRENELPQLTNAERLEVNLVIQELGLNDTQGRKLLKEVYKIRHRGEPIANQMYLFATQQDDRNRNPIGYAPRRRGRGVATASPPPPPPPQPPRKFKETTGHYAPHPQSPQQKKQRGFSDVMRETGRAHLIPPRLVIPPMDAFAFFGE